MKANAKKETIYANIIMLAVFFFAFLGTEYLFDNCMMYLTDASGVVRAQNQMLGVSAIGFLLYNWISGFLADKSPWVTGGNRTACVRRWSRMHGLYYPACGICADDDRGWGTVFPAGAACILSVCRLFLGIFHSWIYGYLLS